MFQEFSSECNLEKKKTVPLWANILSLMSTDLTFNDFPSNYHFLIFYFSSGYVWDGQMRHNLNFKWVLSQEVSRARIVQLRRHPLFFGRKTITRTLIPFIWRTRCSTTSILKFYGFEFRIVLLLDWLPYSGLRTKSTLLITQCWWKKSKNQGY